jgi:hypothetical protein
VSRYAAGRRLEWKTRKALKNRGYLVIRSAGSKGPADLVAFKDNHFPVFVQCKRGKMSRKEWMEFVDISWGLQVIPVCADLDGLWHLFDYPKRDVFMDIEDNGEVE